MFSNAISWKMYQETFFCVFCFYYSSLFGASNLFFFVTFPAVLQARKLMTDSLNISETLSVVDAVQDILVLLHALWWKQNATVFSAYWYI